jgi:Family of unknown function (DUF6093)
VSINFVRARKSVEKVMGGSCTITRFSSKASEVTLDRETGKITENTASTTIYEGPFFAVPVSSSAQSQYVDRQVGMDASALSWQVSVRYDADEIREGDWIIFDEAQDPLLADARMKISRVEKTEVLVWRRFVASEVNSARGS